MTTVRSGPDRSRFWPIPSRQHHYAPATKALAAFLADRPGEPLSRPDTVVLTHTQVRCTGLAGDRVHRLDSARGLRFYTTACGLRVAKTAGVLVADDVDCLHFGCRERAT